MSLAVKHGTKITVKLFAAVIILISLVQSLQAANTYRIPAVADAHVSSAFPTTNDGSNYQMFVGQVPGSGLLRGFLRFDLSQIPASEANAVQSVTLKIYNSGAQSGSCSFSVKSCATSWTETSITWNNQPSTSDDVGSGISFLVPFNYNLISLEPSHMSNWLSGSSGNFGYSMVSGAEAQSCAADLRSREFSSPETLIVVTSPQTTCFSGRVVNCQTGLGLAGAQVDWGVYGTATDQNGFYSFNFNNYCNLGCGTNDLVIQKNCFETYQLPYTPVCSGSDQVKDVCLNPVLSQPVISCTPGPNSITISWNTVEGATDYCVYRDNIQIACGVVDLFWEDQDPNSAERCYHVVAKSALCESRPSNQACCATEPILFVCESDCMCSDFDQNNGISWTVINGEWDLSNGEYSCSSDANSWASSRANVHVSDGTVEFDATAQTGSITPEITLEFREQAGGNRYEFVNFGWGNSFSALLKYVDGSAQFIGSAVAESGILNHTYHFRVVLTGSHLQLYRDGAPIYDVIDPDISEAGTFTLHSYNSHIHFDNVKACGLKPWVSYTTFQGQQLGLYPWSGDKIVFLTRIADLDQSIMNRIVSAVDAGYAYYHQATGHEPISFPSTTIDGKGTVADVPSTCGAGCAYLGYTGIELQNNYFDLLYDNVVLSDEFDQVVFYELGRNFWFYGNKLEYFVPHVSGSITSGFAVFMRFKSMEAAGVQGGDFNGQPFSYFKDEVIGLIDRYLQDPSLNWENTLGIGQAPANPLNLQATDLFASFLFRLERDYGESAFSDNIWKEVENRPDAQTTQEAIDNFVLAACAAANCNLVPLFQEWRWPVSATAESAGANYPSCESPVTQIWVDPVSEDRLQSQVMMTNATEVSAFTLPLSHDSPIAIDSVVSTGCRTDYWDYFNSSIDNLNRTILIGGIANMGSGTPCLSPGNGCIARIYWHRSCESTTVVSFDISFIPPAGHLVVLDCQVPNNEIVPEVLEATSQFESTMPGDVNGDWRIDVGDVVCLLNYIFGIDCVPDPLCMGDVNGSCRADITDCVYLINYIFVGGPLPIQPCSVNSPETKLFRVDADVIVLKKQILGNTTIEVSTRGESTLSGIQLQFRVRNEVTGIKATSSDPRFQVFSGFVDGEYRVGLIDLTGKSTLPAGENQLLTITHSGDGELQLRGAILVDSDAHEMNVAISQQKVETTLPSEFVLYQNQPNPFNPSTDIAFSLPKATSVKLVVYNLLGQEVAKVVDEFKSAGTHRASWNGRDANGNSVASGVYLYRLEAGEFSQTRKMVLLK